MDTTTIGAIGTVATAAAVGLVKLGWELAKRELPPQQRDTLIPVAAPAGHACGEADRFDALEERVAQLEDRSQQFRETVIRELAEISTRLTERTRSTGRETPPARHGGK